MPRTARVKSPYYIYHVMCRSISEVLLFRDDEDKNYYLELLKNCKERNRCKIYGYCLLDTHLHIHLDPQGYDISKFMHSINVSYVIYYNRKYKRHGHVFQGRYESRVVSSDSYNLALSAYIHNNAKDIEAYRDRVHEYPYSSIGFYLGIRKDIKQLVDTSFILGLISTQDPNSAIAKYYEFVTRHLHTGNVKSIIKCLEHNKNNITHDERKIIIREAKPGQVAEFIINKLSLPAQDFIQIKYRREAVKARAFLAFVLRALCGIGYKELCSNIGNMSAAGLSKLCSRGFYLFVQEQSYTNLFNEIINLCKT